jgi:hypothetical protein
MTEAPRSGGRRGPLQRLATGAGALLLLCGSAAFVVFPARRGFDLAVAVANLLLGLGLVLLGRKTPGAGWGRSLAIALGLASAPYVLLQGLIATVHEIGEIVVLRTTDERAVVHETRVAVLDFEGSTWVGADTGRRRWLERLATNPELELVRDGVARCYVAVRVEDPRIREEVFRRIERKYLVGRLVEALGRPLFVRESPAPGRASVAVRLDPCPATPTRAEPR